MRKKYERLREQYPEYISKIQLYKICSISPRSATYLLDHGIIPAVDTGKQTWRYRIALDDVITYLYKREQSGSMIPPGSVSSRYKRLNNPRKSFSALVTPGQENEIAEYFAYIYADFPDVLTVTDIMEMTGLVKNTVLRMLRAGYIKSIANDPKYLVPKPYLLEFVTTLRFIEAKSSSEEFKRILGGYEIWKAAKS